MVLRFLSALLVVVLAGGCDSETMEPHPPVQPWVEQESGVSTPIWSVSHATERILVAVGAFGTILRSVDGGLTWNPVESGTIWHLRDVTFVDSLVGYVVGGQGQDGLILKTTDGGLSWSQAFLGNRSWIAATHFLGSAFGIAVGGGGAIYRTEDGGVSWQEMDSGLAFESLDDVRIVSDSVAVAVGDHVVVRSVDGGDSWQRYADPVRWLHALEFFSSSRGLAVGQFGSIHLTDDAGQSWTLVDSSVLTNFQGVDALDSMTAVVVGGDNILTSHDGGHTWEILETEAAGLGHYDVDFTSPLDGVVVGDGGKILVSATQK